MKQFIKCNCSRQQNVRVPHSCCLILIKSLNGLLLKFFKNYPGHDSVLCKGFRNSGHNQLEKPATIYHQITQLSPSSHILHLMPQLAMPPGLTSIEIQNSLFKFKKKIIETEYVSTGHFAAMRSYESDQLVLKSKIESRKPKT